MTIHIEWATVGWIFCALGLLGTGVVIGAFLFMPRWR